MGQRLHWLRHCLHFGSTSLSSTTPAGIAITSYCAWPQHHFLLVLDFQRGCLAEECSRGDKNISDDRHWGMGFPTGKLVDRECGAVTMHKALWPWVISLAFLRLLEQQQNSSYLVVLWRGCPWRAQHWQLLFGKQNTQKLQGAVYRF